MFFLLRVKIDGCLHLCCKRDGCCSTVLVQIATLSAQTRLMRCTIRDVVGSPATLANLLDLIFTASKVTKVNISINYFFILYQVCFCSFSSICNVSSIDQELIKTGCTDRPVYCKYYCPKYHLHASSLMLQRSSH